MHVACCTHTLRTCCAGLAGMSSPDFGSMHVPGYCPRPDAQDTAAPSTAAQSGIPSMGALVPPRLYPRSCCAPPWPEPLAAAAEAEGAAVIAARQAEREEMEEPLINRLVHDSLQPAAPAAGREDCVPAGGVSGSSSSCRTTTSSKSLDVQQGGVGMGCSQTGVQQQAADYAYAPGLALGIGTPPRVLLMPLWCLRASLRAAT